MQIERHEIRCFHAVIDASGFSRAAERLDLSQSAVSQAITNLEHRLGTVLLRRGNPPQLTGAMIRMLRFAETVLNEERETLADIAQIESFICRGCWSPRRPLLEKCGPANSV